MLDADVVFGVEKRKVQNKINDMPVAAGEPIPSANIVTQKL